MDLKSWKRSSLIRTRTQSVSPSHVPLIAGSRLVQKRVCHMSSTADSGDIQTSATTMSSSLWSTVNMPSTFAESKSASTHTTTIRWTPLPYLQCLCPRLRAHQYRAPTTFPPQMGKTLKNSDVLLMSTLTPQATKRPRVTSCL